MPAKNMPSATPTPQPDPTTSFKESPYGYWVLSSLSETQQEAFLKNLKDTSETDLTKRHLELSAKSVRLVSEKGIEDWKESRDRLQTLIDFTLSSQEPAAEIPTMTAPESPTASTGGLAALPENQG